MRDIAREMQMEAASLYNHISSKQLILSELLLEIAGYFTVGMQRIRSSDLTPIQKLEQLVSLHVDLTVEYTDLISLLPNEWVHLEEPTLKDFLDLRDNYESDFRKIISDSIEAKELSATDIDVALFSILSTLRWLYSWYSKYQSKDVEELKKELIQSLIYGLK